MERSSSKLKFQYAEVVPVLTHPFVQQKFVLMLSSSQLLYAYLIFKLSHKKNGVPNKKPG